MNLNVELSFIPDIGCRWNGRLWARSASLLLHRHFFLFTYLFILTFFFILETMSSFTITGCYIEIGWIITEEVNSWPNFRGWLSRERLITVQSDAIDDLRSCLHRIIESFDQLSLSVFCKKKFRSFALDLVGCLAGILERMGRVTLNLSCINSNGVYLFFTWLLKRLLLFTSERPRILAPSARATPGSGSWGRG